MGLMKKLTSAVVASSLVLGLFGTALAAPTAEEANAAYERLNYYGIAEGILREDGTKDPALDETLTRVQMVALLVKAFGLKESAQYMAGAQTFSDVPANHWASGYLAIAKNIAEKNGNVIGYPDGTFGPENQVTAIEVLGFALKFLGIPVSGGANWKDNMIAAAKDAGVLTDADVEKYLSNPDEVATRGLAFAMADAIFYNYKGADGKSVYTRIDTEVPSVTLGEVPATTNKASIEITGTVSGDYIEVYVGSDKVTVNPDGTFAHAVALKVGSNSIEVTAKDRAGNVGSAKAVVERVPGEAAKIQITAPEGGVAAGSTIDLPVAIVDAEGANTGITDFKVDAGEAGTWADGKLTAGTKAGKYTITVTYEGLEPATAEIEIVAGPLAKVEAETKSVKPGTAVKLIGVDQYGNKVEGVTFAEAEDYAEAFIEGDQFIATKPGTYKVVGTKGEGEAAVTAEGTVSVFGDHASFDIAVDGELVANGATEYTVTVTAVDKDGNAVTDFEDTVTLETNLEFAKDQSPQVKAKDGVATFKVIVPEGMEGLEAEFTAKYQKDEKSDVIEASETFEVKAQVATKLELEADKYLAINVDSAFSGKVKVLDQMGEKMLTGDSVEVTLTITGPAYFEDTDDKEIVVDVGGELPFVIEPVDRYTDGTVTITATAEGLTSDSVEVIAAYAMDPKNVVFKAVSSEAQVAGTWDYNDEAGDGKKYDFSKGNGKAFEFEIRLSDKNGVPVAADKAYDLELVFDSDKAKDELAVSVDGENWYGPDKDGKVKFPSAFKNAGQASVKVQVKAKKLTGDIKVTANIKDLTSATGTVSFKANEIDTAVFDPANVYVLANEEFPLTLVVKDEAGNVVPKAGLKVQVWAVGADQYVKLDGKNRSDKSPLEVTTGEDGKATIKALALSYLKTYTIKANVLDGDTELVKDVEAKVNVASSVAKSISVTTWTYSDEGGWKRVSSVDAGTPFWVFAQVTDNNGIKLTDSDIYTVTDRLSVGKIDGIEKKFGTTYGVAEGDATLGVNTPGGGAVDAWVAGPFVVTDADRYTVKVTDSGSPTKVEATRSISVVAGDANKLAYDGDDEMTFKNGEVLEITLSITDKHGNKVPAAKVTKDFITSKYKAAYEKHGKYYVDVELKADEGANATDGEYAMIRLSENGGGTNKVSIELKQFVNTYKVYVVINELSDPADGYGLYVDHDGDGPDAAEKIVTLKK
ncbi:MAG: S-layer homology domain-containing protein [Symbiobacterium sp.]|uniref:S-layer homology domain-containing protein n=1 Tax=Symbiobacterium sp. TaxID=1971213 RepID=UPI00346446C6